MKNDKTYVSDVMIKYRAEKSKRKKRVAVAASALCCVGLVVALWQMPFLLSDKPAGTDPASQYGQGVQSSQLADEKVTESVSDPGQMVGKPISSKEYDDSHREDGSKSQLSAVLSLCGGLLCVFAGGVVILLVTRKKSEK